MKIWLSDLTYTQQTISSDVVPAAIGMLAEYLEASIDSQTLDIKLFKYPEDLIKEIESATNCPVIVSGGYGESSHLENLLSSSWPSGIAFASVLHYQKSLITLSLFLHQ